MDLVIVQLIEYAIWAAIVAVLGILALVAAGAVHEGRAQPALGQRGARVRRAESPVWSDGARWDDAAAESDDAAEDERALLERRLRAA